jgi:5-oxoprolinase (ATP-hydrolysing)
VSGPRPAALWEFWIDRGGTFTDLIARAPDGALHTAKLLSSDDAPVLAIRAVLERAGALAPGGEPPACRVKLGSTLATNALLERRGVPTLYVANRGLGDVPAIGTQERPALFDLRIEKPRPLHREVVEVSGRVGARGEEVEAPDTRAALAALRGARSRGCRAIAIALIHAYAFPEREQELAALARELGFEHVVASHEIARELGLLARAETAIADAYLTPLLREHARRLARALPGAQLRFMQSSGGLTDAPRFRGPNALLSGPAGGALGAARVAERAGFERAVGFAGPRRTSRSSSAARWSAPSRPRSGACASARRCCASTPSPPAGARCAASTACASRSARRARGPIPGRSATGAPPAAGSP